eukprot:TRINITY_DN8571_c0_g5_i1.p1 TRINITY_DN8571_c0_g5~~TRINITY_DN8571_c0_g5_i1.p1  ORF type:complete len:629 (+),score=109.75 TRINITY_DN8571_c0_g5_i1:168-2054(+)
MNCMATCHSIQRYVKPSGEEMLIGDPMEIRMFEFTRADFSYLIPEEEKDHVDFIANMPDGAHIVIFKKKFEFDSDVQRMTTLAQVAGQPGLLAFVKGSPEVIKGLCRNNSLPPNYEEELYVYAERGFRVLALAYRELHEARLEDVDNLERREVESNLIFIGFLVFSNNLKPATCGTIDRLKSAGLAINMITGDNPATAFNVAKNCHILNENVKPLFGDVEVDGIKVWLTIRDSFQARHQEPHSVDIEAHVSEFTAKLNLKKYQKGKCTEEAISFINSIVEAQINKNLSFVFVGNVFEELVIKAPPSRDLELALDRLLTRSQVYTRMQPSHKAKLVEFLQQTNERIVAMCGDGANDTAALKAAYVGLSLSEAEASIAAPFTSKIQDISSMETLLLEGRCCLTTNIQCFKFIALYAMIQFASTTILYFFMATLSSMQYLYIDFFTITPLFTTMAMTGPSNKLTKRLPSDTLFDLENMTSLIAQILIQLLGQVIVIWMLTASPFYIPAITYWDPDVDDNVRKCQETTVLFLFSSVLYLASVLTFNNSYPFKNSNLKNLPYVTSISVLAINSIIMFFVQSLRIGVLEIVDSVPLDFLLITFIGALVISALMYSMENFVIHWVFHSEKKEVIN